MAKVAAVDETRNVERNRRRPLVGNAGTIVFSWCLCVRCARPAGNFMRRKGVSRPGWLSLSERNHDCAAATLRGAIPHHFLVGLQAEAADHRAACEDVVNHELPARCPRRCIWEMPASESKTRKVAKRVRASTRARTKPRVNPGRTTGSPSSSKAAASSPGPGNAPSGVQAGRSTRLRFAGGDISPLGNGNPHRIALVAGQK